MLHKSSSVFGPAKLNFTYLCLQKASIALRVAGFGNNRRATCSAIRNAGVLAPSGGRPQAKWGDSKAFIVWPDMLGLTSAALDLI